MEELGSVWVYQEGVDELREKLLHRTVELESLKMEATEEIRKINENVKNLQELLKMAYSERDEARNQLQILMERLRCSNSDKFQTHLSHCLPHLQSESPMFVPTKANSSITESNSLSHDSPADSFFDTVSSPDFSNINMADSSKTGAFNEQLFIDPSLEVIENIAKGKPLPQNGKLLQAVMEAGPLLQTLLVAGPLPRWRNPPPLEPFKIPPFSIKASQSKNFDQNPPPKSSISAHKQQTISPCSEIFRGSSQMCSASILGINRTSPGSCFDIPDGKRQRFQ